MREVPDAELWVAGERLDSDRGEDMAAMLRSAGLGDRLRLLGYRGRRGGGAGGGRHLRAAQLLRGPADVGDRGDADRPAGRRHRHPRAARASGAGRDGPAGAGRARWRRWPRRCAGWPAIRRCARRWAKQGGSGRSNFTTRRRCWRARSRHCGCKESAQDRRQPTRLPRSAGGTSRSAANRMRRTPASRRCFFTGCRVPPALPPRKSRAARRSFRPWRPWRCPPYPPRRRSRGSSHPSAR